MGQRFDGKLILFTAAILMAGCAANPPAATTAPRAPVAAAAPAVSAAATAKPAAAPKGVRAGSAYRRVVKNGTEYFCRRESMTGSRTEVQETCLTQAQLDKVQNDSQDLVRRLEGVPGQVGGMDSNGGTTNSVMGR
jgi:hypothetical protein